MTGWLGRAFATNYALPARSPDHECCVWVGHVLRSAWGDPVMGHSGVPWPADGRWRGELFVHWHLWDRSRPWSPVEAADRAGLVDGWLELVGGARSPAVVVHGDPEGWRLVQGWRLGGASDPAATGHTFFVRRSHPTHAGLLLVVDSTAATGARVRWVTERALVTEFSGGLAVAPLVRP